MSDKEIPKNAKTIEVGVTFEQTDIGVEMHLKFRKSHSVEDYDPRLLFLAGSSEFAILEAIKIASQSIKSGGILLSASAKNPEELREKMKSIRKKAREIFKKSEN